MRFLYHHRTTGRGAEGNHIMALVHPLESAGHRVTIVSPPGVDPRRTAGQTPLDKGAAQQRGISRMWQWMSKQAPQILFEVAELGYNFFAAAKLTLAVLRRRPDVYYERYAFFLAAGVLVTRLFRIPVMIEVNEVVGIKRARGQILVRLAQWIEALIFARADAIFVVSSFLRQQVIARGARPALVHLMPNAIDVHRFDLNGSRGKVRRERRLEGAFVAGFVGWFDHWDRLDVLVEVADRIRRAHPNFRLMLVGDGPVADGLRAQVARLGLDDSVILTGAVRRDQVPAYIDCMDVCVLPDSNPYGSPMVLFEFMALGKAVVAADVPPVRDVMVDGENGVLVPPADAEAITAALHRLIEDPSYRSQLGERSRAYVCQHRTWEANADRVATLAGSWQGAAAR